MQTRRPISRRTRQTKRDLLDQKWLTYLLTFILIVLLAILVLSLKYQERIIQYVKDLLSGGRRAPAPRPHLKAKVGRFESENLMRRPAGLNLLIPSPLTLLPFLADGFQISKLKVSTRLLVSLQVFEGGLFNSTAGK